MNRTASLVSAMVIGWSALGTPHARTEGVLAYYAPAPDCALDVLKKGRSATGLFIVHINPTTGRVTRIETKKSTGYKVLDECAVKAYRQWRFTRGVPAVRCPITFSN